MPKGVRACLGRRMALLRPNRNVIDPRFLLYFYVSPAFQSTIAKHTIQGATVPRIGLATMPRWPVEIPPLDEQRAIAEVLGALDDKLASNHSRLCLIDDVCAAQVTQSTRHEAVSVQLRDVLTLHYGRALPASKRLKGQVPVYGSGGVTGTHAEALVAGPGVVVGRKGTVGAVYWADGPHFPIDTTYFVEARSSWRAEILYFLLRALPLGELNSDSAVPGLNRDEAYAQWVRIPADPAAQSLGDELTIRLAFAKSIRAESKRLSQARDELLPQLMARRMRVRDAERVVEGMV